METGAIIGKSLNKMQKEYGHRWRFLYCKVCMRVFDAEIEGIKRGEKCYKCHIAKLVVYNRL